MIRIENLTKSYADVKAVNDISFNVEKGTLFAFFGY
jgi:multidrug/hemolysin transport system ATP-binding protein